MSGISNYLSVSRPLEEAMMDLADIEAMRQTSSHVVARLQDQATELRDLIEVMKETRDAHRETISTLRRDAQDLRDEIVELEAEANALKQSRKDALKTCAQLVTQTQHMDKKRATLQRDMDGLHEAFATLSTEKHELQKEVDEMRQKLAALNLQALVASDRPLPEICDSLGLVEQEEKSWNTETIVEQDLDDIGSEEMGDESGVVQHESESRMEAQPHQKDPGMDNLDPSAHGQNDDEDEVEALTGTAATQQPLSASKNDTIALQSPSSAPGPTRLTPKQVLREANMRHEAELTAAKLENQRLYAERRAAKNKRKRAKEAARKQTKQAAAPPKAAARVDEAVSAPEAADEASRSPPSDTQDVVDETSIIGNAEKGGRWWFDPRRLMYIDV